MFLLHHPEVQEKVHQEIDQVLGPKSNRRSVSLEDKASLPYTQAVLMESMRMASIVPNALPHEAVEDIELEDFVIPKGSALFANILYVHFDPENWHNPEQFRPERFLDEETNTFKPNEKLIPFSIGKRYCLGQSLAEKEYFMFFVGLLQNFEFLPPKSEDLPKIGRDDGINVGVLRGAPLYKTVLKAR